MTFKNIAFGDLCEEIYRYPSYYGIDYVESGIPEIRGELIQNNGTIDLNIENWRFIDTVTADRFPRTTLREDDLVMSVRGTIGKVALIPHQLDGANMTANLLRISPNRSIVFPRYLWSYMRSDYFGQVLDHISPSTTIKTIRVPDLKQVDVPLPPLAEQQRIAAILDKADGLRAKRRAALAKLDTLLQATFLDMFGDPVSNPMGWEVKRLDHFGKIITGSTPSRKKPEYYGDYIEWIKSDNINTPYHTLTIAQEHLSEAGFKVGRTVPKNSILVTCIAGSPDCIGNAAIADRSVAFNQQINAITPYQDRTTHFLYIQFLVGKRLVQGASTNSMKGMVSKSSFSGIEFISPPLEMQRKFSQDAAKIQYEMKKHDCSLEKFDNLFHSLQQRAFKGEL